MKKTLMVAAFALVAASTGFGAPLRAGLNELKLEFSAGQNPDAYDALPVAVSVGYFLVDNVVAGGRIGFRKANWDSYWKNGAVWDLGAYGEYHFDIDAPLQPFVGARASVLDGNQKDDTVFELSGYAGAKLFLTENLALTLALALHWANEEIYDLDPEVTGRRQDGSKIIDDRGDSVGASIEIGARLIF